MESKHSLKIGVSMLMIVAVLAVAACGGAANNAAANGGTAKPTTTPLIVYTDALDDECPEDIERETKGLAGLDLVECDVEKKTVKAYPKQGETISVKALWEAVDKAINQEGKKVVKIDGPDGMVTAKPDK